MINSETRLKIISILNILFVVAMMTAPYLIYAQGSNSSIDSRSVADSSNPLVQCETVDDCHWNELLNTLNRAKDYGFQIVVIMSVIFIVYAGMLYLTSAGDSGKITKARNILSNVVIGFFLAAAGWLIVRTILKTLGVEDNELAPSDLTR